MGRGVWVPACAGTTPNVVPAPSPNFQTAPTTRASASPATRRARGVLKSPPPRGRGECRVPDAPAAARGVVVNTRVSHHGYTGSPGIPARDGFNGFLRALPGDRACLPPSPAESLHRLDASVGASGPHDFTVRRTSAFVKAPPTSPASRPASVTIASRPSGGTRRGEIWI